MSSPSTFAALRTRQICQRMATGATQAAEAIATVAVFSAIGALLAWRG